WGVHDEYVFDRLLTDLRNEKQPFFSTMFTLSSHEPYDVPVNFIPGNKNEVKFCNSIKYTDSCLAVFLNKAKEESWWDNTLVVIVADHGHVFPGINDWPVRVPEEFHIPMLWTGGALKQKGVVKKIASQTDIAATLLN